MNLIEALNTCKETGGKLVKDSWLTNGIPVPDYVIPSYIYWNTHEEAYVAVFGMDADCLPDVCTRIPEDYLGGVIVSNFSVQDILAEDWEVVT